jgi:hypothetical protein
MIPPNQGQPLSPESGFGSCGDLVQSPVATALLLKQRLWSFILGGYK